MRYQVLGRAEERWTWDTDTDVVYTWQDGAWQRVMIGPQQLLRTGDVELVFESDEPPDGLRPTTRSRDELLEEFQRSELS